MSEHMDEIKELILGMDHGESVVVIRDSSEVEGLSFLPGDNYDILSGWAAVVLDVAYKHSLSGDDIRDLLNHERCSLSSVERTGENNET